MDSQEVWRRLHALLGQLLDEVPAAPRPRFAGLYLLRRAAARRELRREWQHLCGEVARLRIGIDSDPGRGG